MTRAVLASLILALALTVVPSASAQDPSAGDQAVALGREAMELYNVQKWVQAYDRFAQAERSHHSPVFVLYMARCKLQVGDLIAARGLLRQVEAEIIDPGAPASWQRAREDATNELALLGPRISSVRIRVAGDQSEPATVHIDGRLIADYDDSIEVNPGEHKIEARSGERTARTVVDLAEGARDQLVALELPVRPEPSTPRSSGPSAYTMAGVMLLGLAGAGLVVGAVTGGLALKATNDIKENCIDTSCLKSDEEEGNRANVLATVSTVSFVIAGATAAGGLALILVPIISVETNDAGMPAGVYASLYGSF